MAGRPTRDEGRDGLIIGTMPTMTGGGNDRNGSGQSECTIWKDTWSFLEGTNIAVGICDGCEDKKGKERTLYRVDAVIPALETARAVFEVERLLPDWEFARELTREGLKLVEQHRSGAHLDCKELILMEACARVTGAAVQELGEADRSLEDMMASTSLTEGMNRLGGNGHYIEPVKHEETGAREFGGETKKSRPKGETVNEDGLKKEVWKGGESARQRGPGLDKT